MHILSMKISIKLFIYHIDFLEITFFLFSQRADNSLQEFYVQKGKLLFMYYSCKFGVLNFYRFWLKLIFLSLYIEYLKSGDCLNIWQYVHVSLCRTEKKSSINH
jgi:hypothetical protein